jgi:hypothetical protein
VVGHGASLSCAFIDQWNDHPHPFAWTKDADEVLPGISRAKTKTSQGLTDHEEERVDSRSADENTSWIVVANNYQWIGNPAAAGFTVYVDGKRAGVVPLGDTFSQRVEQGRHVVRVRCWYFLSPRVKLDLRPGETRRFSADIPRKLRLWRRIMRAMADPLHSLSLEEVAGA